MQRLCIFCKHFYLDMGYPDLSDTTPGAPAEIACCNRHWEMKDYDDDRDFRMCIETALDCPDYEYIPIEEM